MNKVRLDSLLIQKGLADSRRQAVGMIMAGDVSVEDVRVDKAGMFVKPEGLIKIKERMRYVSKGALKLESVATKLGINFKNSLVLDVGSSTGGFTDFALSKGARRAYAVDVGTNQLDHKLRVDPRVIVMEKTDIRDVKLAKPTEFGIKNHELSFIKSTISTSSFVIPAQPGNQPVAELAKKPTVSSKTIPEVPDIILIDVSFISLRLVLPAITKLSDPKTQIVAMVKPQFEAGAKVASKHKGVIKNNTIRRQILKDFELWAKQSFVIKAKADSEVHGQKGNIERFYLLKVIKR